jgi:transcriptional regulator GlxA family with amidase domain
VSECIELLSRKPGLSNGELAKHQRVSAHRLSREFQNEMGLSLLDYRNELRLERFFALVGAAENDGRALSLVELALEAGFGSYSQFHRVFSGRFGRSPRDHLQP